MTTTTRRTRLVSLIVACALAVGAPFALAGCSVIEGVVEDQTGGDVDLGGDEIPADFPEEVPLAEGEVVFGAAVGNDADKVWNVTIEIGDGTLEQITTQFTDAGFTATPVTQRDDGAAITFAKEPFGVLVVVGADGDGNAIANYTVTKKSS